MTTNATQLTGIAAFAVATLACAVAALRVRRPWCWLALANAAYALEVAIGLRYRLHDSADRAMRLRGWYGAREGWQTALLAVGALLAVLAIAALTRYRPREPAAGTRLALFATLAAAALFGVETISLHATDALLYAPLGPVKRIAWAWSALAACVVVGAACPPSR